MILAKLARYFNPRTFKLVKLLIAAVVLATAATVAPTGGKPDPDDDSAF